MALSQSLEDYLEQILITKMEKGVVRVKDIVERLGVSSASVVGALQHLEKDGLVRHERYGYIELTEKGKKRARCVYSKHSAIMRFFTDVLGIPPEVAESDACSFEHFISPLCFQRMLLFMRFALEGKKPAWLEEFHRFIEKSGKGNGKKTERKPKGGRC